MPLLRSTAKIDSTVGDCVIHPPLHGESQYLKQLRSGMGIVDEGRNEKENQRMMAVAEVIEPTVTGNDNASNATALPESTEAPIEGRPAIWRRLANWVLTLIAFGFRFASLVVGLAILAVTPILQFVALGYLLEACGRVGRTGRLRGSLPGLVSAGRIGAVTLGALVSLLPAIFLVSLRDDAALIAPTSKVAGNLRFWAGVVTFFTVVNGLAAFGRAGQFGSFFRPIKNLRWLLAFVRNRQVRVECWQRIRSAWTSAEVGRYLWFGFRGFLGALLWLAIPSGLMAASRGSGGAAFIGGVLFFIVVLYLPFLQAHFAAENRLSAYWEVNAVRKRFQRAPLAFLVSLFFTLALSIPLYLFKIEIVPRDAYWLLAIAFVLAILPLKLLMGWSYGHGSRQPQRAFFGFRWASWLLMLPLAATYTLLVFLTQYISWKGAASLLENHTFLIPAPFF